MSTRPRNFCFTWPDRIEADPDSYDQADWFYLQDGNGTWESSRSTPLEVLRAHEEAQEIRCGSAACIAGHAVIAAPERVRALSEETQMHMVATGAALLGLDYDTSWILFTEARGRDHRAVAALLRALAEIPAEERADTSDARSLVLHAIEDGV